MDIIERIKEHLADTYHRLPVVIQRGKGFWLWDEKGKRYFDMLSCYSAAGVGHCDPRLVKAAYRQMQKLDSISNAFFNDQLIFVEELAEFCNQEKVLLMNTGTEAVERGIKISRKWGYGIKGVKKDKAEIVVCKNNFHGRTYGSLSASTEPLYIEAFGPFLPGFVKIPFGDLTALEEAINENTVAFLVEPIQAEAGIIIPPPGYLREAKEICQKSKVLFILDEVQTGLCRTGKIFCYEHDDAKPDILILGKFLGGDLYPLSAVVGPKDIIDIFRPGEDGSTFSANPIACAIGREVLKIIKQEKLAERAAASGKYFLEKLKEIESPYIKEIRGKGLLIGVELKKEAGGARRFCEKLMEEGMLCKETHENIIRFAPPLTVTQKEMDWAFKRIRKVFSQI